jgi:regulation of enolase protein 1 (concanavalin A-like superfamily)
MQFRRRDKRIRAAVVESLERRELLSGTWTTLAHAAPGGVGTMMLLPDGSVITSINGTSNQWARLVPDATGSYVNGTWSQLASSEYTRLYGASQVLPDGRAFIAGGEYGTGGDNGEIYTPITNTWAELPAQPYGNFSDSESILLADGDVLITPVSPSQSGYTTLFHPSTNTWSQGPKLYRGGDADEQGFVKLADSSILTIDSNTTSERYIPPQNQWVNDGAVPVKMFDGLGEIGPGLLLSDGRAFYLGSTGNTALYTPSGSSSPGAWVAGPTIPGGLGTDDAPAALLPDGTVLCAVGPSGTYNGPTSFYIYNPTQTTGNPEGSFTAVTGAPTVSGPPFVSRMLDLPNGTILYTDGGTTLYQYSPGTPALAAAVPNITSIAPNSDGSLTLSGTNLNGIDAGAAYGDDAQMDSNYPIITMTSGSNVYYARSYGWSSTGVVVGSETVSFTLPLGIPAGTYSVRAIANGVASSPVSLSLSDTASNAAPTIAAPAAASPTTTGTTTASLSVLGADDAGESNLVYTWTTLSVPSGARLPSYSVNGSNAAKNTTVTFSHAGTYTFSVTITDSGGLSVASSTVTGIVTQTESSLSLTPALSSLSATGTKQLTASDLDQFGLAMSPQPTFMWSVASGGGTVSTSGLYTAPSSGTLATVTVSHGSFSASAQIGVVDSPWKSTDIGSVGLTGTAYDNGTTYTVEASGSDIWGTADEFHFVYQTLTGDGTITAEVLTQTNTNAWAKTGVMIRNSLEANDQYAIMSVTPGNGTTMQYRATSGASAVDLSTTGGLTAPYWVRLARSGNVITGYRSADGVTWVAQGSITIAMGTSVYVGLEADSHDNSALNTATFGHVAVLQSSSPTIATPAAANPSPVTGTTAALSVLGAVSGGESTITYSWLATSIPAGAATPTFSANNSNAAKNTTVTFYLAGSYTFSVLLTDANGLTATSAVTVTVNQTDTSLSLSPFVSGEANLNPDQSQQVIATAMDQFGKALASQPVFTFNLKSGGGSVTSNGLFTAPSIAGQTTVGVTDGTLSSTLTISTVAPKAYWKFDDDTGTSAIDSTGNGFTGTLQNATWTTGVEGISGIALNGTSGYVAVPALNLNSNTVSFTGWVKRTASESSSAGIVFSRSGSTISGLTFGSANELRYNWNNSSSTYNWNSGLVVPTNQWTFVALVITSSNATIYMEPQGGSMTSATNAVANATQAFSGATNIGQDSSGGRFAAGSIDEVRVYSTSLSAAAIGELATLAPTIGSSVALASSGSPAQAGQPVTLTATIAGTGLGTPTGSVTFKEGTATVGAGSVNAQGVATFTTSSLSVGTHTLQALYGGDTYFVTSASTALTQSITAATTTGLQSSLNPSTFGQSVTFTATLTGAVGTFTGETVSFLDGTTAINSGMLNASGVATFSTSSLSVATHSITASYAGDTNNAPSTSTILSQVVYAPVSVTSVVVNGDNVALAGAQRSMVDSIVYTFSEAVTIGGNAFAIAVHTGEQGTVPTLTWTAINPDASGASTQWEVTFSGASVIGNSIANGVYDITLNVSTVSSEAHPTAAVTPRATDTFYRLYGDYNGDQVVNAIDNLHFKSAITTYNPIFDYDDNGAVNAADNLHFKASISFSFNAVFTATI